eukprot:CAMPEP_0202943260 /NCGR_PEP_ID=MMETSP1395-20130829/3641_1 /ASSEMBLY_ACC=CAM_ASM_000871 /TAXON_ID=5961 /ORGANISM="Blepharisma japonicum, Strain Stock R1072" /LENGTH=59 /DNA_ID=CAMNT_0049640505 /DNA_START=18 /DNA_END=197 /DNA_ORIENTATION=+
MVSFRESLVDLPNELFHIFKIKHFGDVNNLEPVIFDRFSDFNACKLLFMGGGKANFFGI